MFRRATLISAFVGVVLVTGGCGGSTAPSGPAPSSTSRSTPTTCKPGETPLTNNPLLHGDGCRRDTVEPAP